MTTEPTYERVARVFNGSFTIENKATGEHRTFDIRTQPDDANFAPGKRIVALLTGPNNEYDYQGFGFIDDQGITVWHKNRGEGNRMSVYEWYAIMLWGMTTNEVPSGIKFDPGQYNLLHEGRCVRCNRKLTTPESIKTGIGPVCRERM